MFPAHMPRHGVGSTDDFVLTELSKFLSLSGEVVLPMTEIQTQGI